MIGSNPNSDKRPVFSGIAGPSGGESNDSSSEILHQLQKFWELEEVKHLARVPPADVACEQFFVKEHRRDVDGRYVVGLPFKQHTLPDFGDTKQHATRMLRRMQQRMNRDELFRAHYIKFMTEYKELGHMQPVEAEEASEGNPRSIYPIMVYGRGPPELSS